MTKKEFIEQIKKTAGYEMTTKAATDIVDSVFSTITKTVKKEGRFSYAGFGVFNLRKRKARKGRNPQTGEIIKVKASKTVGFRPSPTLKAQL